MAFRPDVLAIVLASCALVACRSSLGFEPDGGTSDSRSAGSGSLDIVGPTVIQTKGLYGWGASLSGVSVTACEIHWSAAYPPSTVPVDLGVGTGQHFMVRAGDGDVLLRIETSCLPSQAAELLVLNRIGADPS